MNKEMTTNKPESLDFDLFIELFEATPALEPAPDAKNHIKTKLMQRVAQSRDAQFFVFSEQGHWKSMNHGIQVKILKSDDQAKSFLLKLEQNTIIPYHDHQKNEETFVIDGEVWLDGIHCKNGDYHFAGAGTFHKEIRTESGCTLLIKTY
ncbi:cupin domain-containing protein [Methylophilus sp. 5]|uniref:cupin domain-containing protein n=1 Tax=Methylophilus sp. 5 TaxID=1112274 RepID=UPI0004B90174|nr:cupin domain-containing protein [Methylophilus sp. 5]